MSDRDEPLSSDELLRRAREDLLRQPGTASPPDDDNEAPDDALEMVLGAPVDQRDTPPVEEFTEPAPSPAPTPTPTPARRTDPVAVPVGSSGRKDIWASTVAAAIVGILIAIGVALAVRVIGGDDPVDRTEAITEGVESGLRDGLETMGLPETTVSCVLDGIRASGAYDRLGELDDSDIATLATIPPDAPLSSYPPQFRPIAEATAQSMVACVDPSDSGGLALGTGQPNELGDDPDFDRLWNACETTGGEECDLLYLVSPAGSDYEAFGATCGNRNDPTEGACMDLNGDGPRLDVWRDQCAAGDAGGCDLLYQFSPLESEDEAFGTTCGGRDDPSPLSCWIRFGPRLG